MKLISSAASLWILLACLSLISVGSALYNYCQAPDTPLYGSHDGGYQTSYEEGSIVIYSCYSGYSLEGLSRLQCVHNIGTDTYVWNYSTPKCVQRYYANSCPKPPALKNGVIKASRYSVGSVIKYICNDGYILRGSSIRRCLSSRKWSNRAPTCSRVRARLCPYLNNPENGYINQLEGRKIGAKVWYFCNNGYILVGRESRTCQRNLKWSSNKPICKSSSCGIPESLDNGRVSFLGTSVGSKATYSCNNHFILVGARRRVCQNTGRWAPKLPICKQQNTCPYLVTPNNGGIVFSKSLNAGSRARYQCNRGYELKGNKIRTCQSGGYWSGNDPECKGISCKYLPDIHQGSVSVSGRYPGSAATYSCDTLGYELIGNRKRVCQNNGEWDGEEPVCQTIQCAQLENPANGKVIISGTIFRSTAIYKCDPGFVRSGQFLRTCQNNGYWSGEAPTCRPVNCGALEDPNNGRVSLSGTTFHSTANYECISGYVISGTNTRTCQFNGQWSGVAPTCRPVDCGSLDAPVNGRISLSGTTFRSTASYKCGSGYILKGVYLRTCQYNGEWSGVAPTCRPVDCGYLEAPSNGNVKLSATTFRSTASYKCDSGYILSGKYLRTCQYNGEWSGESPICRPVDCGYLEAPSNGSISLSGTTFRSTASYKCDPGYILNGKYLRNCQYNGQWSRQAPTCRPVDCGPLEAPGNGSISITDTTFRSTASYKCNRGYILSGTDLRTCQYNGEWSGEVPTCRPVDCGYLDAPGNGSISLSETTFRSTASYKCDPGYILSGTYLRTCQYNGQWSGQAPICRPVDCGYLEAPGNGSISHSGTTFHSTASYKCDPGYILSGKYTRTCQENGQWSEQAPTCRPVDCGYLEAPGNGTISLSGTTFRSTASYKCDPGFILSGKYLRTCRNNGQWSGDAPTCRPVDCGSLNPPGNGTISLSETTFRSTASYKCDPGFILSGKYLRTCQNNGQWSGDAPTCRPVDCGALDDPTNGRVTLSGTTFRSFADYECFSGYVVSGTDTRTCQFNGQWSGVAPTCRPVACGSLDAPSNGRISLSGTTFRSTATYKCDPGFTLSGVYLRICQLNGQWSEVAPTCRRNVFDCGYLSNPENGVVDTSSGTTEGARANYRCNKGYTIKGLLYRTCTSSGWSGKAPTCEGNVFDCGYLSNPVNGVVDTSSGTTEGALAHYYCNTGYTIQGVLYRTCTSSGWSDKAPTCEGNVFDCGYLSNPVNGEVDTSAGTTEGALAHYYCKTGYTIKGTRYRTCTSSGWSGRAPTCEGNVFDCGYLSNPENGVVDTSSGTTEGARANYRCNKGYTIKGLLYRTCTSSGWSGKAPTCEVVDCGILPDPQFGDVFFDTTFQSIATYHCYIGYIINGPDTRTCQANGQWSGVAPTCGPIDCGPLTDPTNGRVDVPGTTFRFTSSYLCNAGYILIGNARRICIANGKWSGEEPTCRSLQCPSLAAPKKGKVVVSSRNVGYTAVYSCFPGYNLKGVPKRTCLSDGSWSGTAPTCVPAVDCGNLDNPLNGFVQLQGTSLGFPAQYSCNRGFHLVGPDIRVCTETGKWSDEAPVCIRSSDGCGDPGTPVNGRRIGDDFFFNSVVFFRCFDDFDLVGSKFRVCQTNGLWSGVQPTCHPFKSACVEGKEHFDRYHRKCKCVNGNFQQCHRLRKDYTGLISNDRSNYINTFLGVVQDPIYNPRYTKLIDTYTNTYLNNITQSTTPSVSQFFMFNRYFLLEFEDLLKDFDQNLTIPFYDWTPFPKSPYTAAVWGNKDGFGDTAQPSDMCVNTGPVRASKYSVTPLSGGGCLKREYKNMRFPSRDVIERNLLPLPDSEFAQFHRFLHLLVAINIQCFVGGTMCSSSAANDPVHILHLSQLDSILTRWQSFGQGRESIRYLGDTSPLLGSSGHTVEQFVDSLDLPYLTSLVYERPALLINHAPPPSAKTAKLKLDCSPMKEMNKFVSMSNKDHTFMESYC